MYNSPWPVLYFSCRNPVRESRKSLRPLLELGWGWGVEGIYQLKAAVPSSGKVTGGRRKGRGRKVTRVSQHRHSTQCNSLLTPSHNANKSGLTSGVVVGQGSLTCQSERSDFGEEWGELERRVRLPEQGCLRCTTGPMDSVSGQPHPALLTTPSALLFCLSYYHHHCTVSSSIGINSYLLCVSASVSVSVCVSASVSVSVCVC